MEIVYHGAPRFGLEFHPEREQFHTVFSTSQWMPCLDAPDARATFDLALVVPRGWITAGNGEPVGRRDAGSERNECAWRLDRAAPTYTFGFAAGRFAEVSEHRAGVTLRALGPPGSEDTLRRVFRETGDLLEFFVGRAGLPYPDSAYTQLLVAETIGQELTGFAELPEALAADVLADSSEVVLIAHELAHPWWGNGVTCRAWTHFWLNEGFAKFMASAWREHGFGQSADSAQFRAAMDASSGVDLADFFAEWVTLEPAR